MSQDSESIYESIILDSVKDSVKDSEKIIIEQNDENYKEKRTIISELPKNKKEEYNIYKIIVVGDANTGKSSILRRFVDNEFEPSYLSTIGVDFKIKNITVDNICSKLQIWDTSGSERFKTFTRSYYRGAHCAILVYDVTDRSTFEAIPYWVEEVDDGTGSIDFVKILVGSKIDLYKKVVETSEGRQLAEKYNMLFIECSSKNNINIESIFVGAIYNIKVFDNKMELNKNNKTKQVTLSTSKIEDINCCF